MMLALWAHRFGVALLCAEGLLVLTSVHTIRIALKRRDQRTPGEAKMVARGLFREFIGEVFIFVPVSAMVASIVMRPIIEKIPFPPDGIDGLVGMVSYGFPYKTLKIWVLRASVRFLKEAAAVADKQIVKEGTNRKERSDAAAE